MSKCPQVAQRFPGGGWAPLELIDALGVRIPDEKIASLKKVQNRGLALFLTENVAIVVQKKPSSCWFSVNLCV